jgi:hypothetical protein
MNCTTLGIDLADLSQILRVGERNIHLLLLRNQRVELFRQRLGCLPEGPQLGSVIQVMLCREGVARKL